MSGLVLVVAPVPEDLHRVVPRLLELPRPVYLDSSLTDSRGGCYSYFTADPFLQYEAKLSRRVYQSDGADCHGGRP